MRAMLNAVVITMGAGFPKDALNGRVRVDADAAMHTDLYQE